MKKWKVFTALTLILGFILLPTVVFAAEGDTYTNKSKFWDYYEIENIFNDGPVKEADLIEVLQDEGYTDSEIEIMLKEGAEREEKVVDRETSEEETNEETKEETKEETETNEEKETNEEEVSEGETAETESVSLTMVLLFVIIFIIFFICYFAI